jgi:hypothetical protein
VQNIGMRISDVLKAQGWVIIIALAPVPAGAFEPISAGEAMPDCRAVIQSDPAHEFWAGFCMGTTFGLIYMDSTICPPAGATADQGVRVIVEYIDARRHRLHEPFARLAVEALRETWPGPCP